MLNLTRSSLYCRLKKIFLKRYRQNAFYTCDNLLYLGNKANIGKHTYGKPRVLEYFSNSRLVIGDYCSIADGVTILLGGNHHSEWLSTYPFVAKFAHFYKYWGYDGEKEDSFSSGDVVIGNDVWICLGVTIMSGVKIGDGAIIAAGSIVTRDVKPYSVVAGIPAREIKKRFTEKQIDELLKIAWWEWDALKIKNNIDLICDDHIDDFIGKFIKNSHV